MILRMKTDVTIYTPTETLKFNNVDQAAVEDGVITVQLDSSDAYVHGDTIKTNLPFLINVTK